MHSNIKVIFSLPLIVALLLSLCCSVMGQTVPRITDSIYSEVLHETRTFRVVMPEISKSDSNARYDVLYLLDGNWNTGMINEIQGHMHRWEFTPSLIIVGIDNKIINNVNQRDRDLTPTHLKGSSIAGGGPKFLSFLKEELVPYINKTYPTNGNNTLLGHSYGGLFAMYAFLSEPVLFKSCIAEDPSFWWDNGYIPKLVAEKLPSIKGARSVFITGRVGLPYHEMGI